MMKRWGTWALALLLVFGAAMPGLAESRAADFAGAADGLIDMDETLDVIWWGFNVSGYLPNEHSEIKQTLEELFNLRITNVPVDNYNAEQVNVMLATGVEFDIRVQSSGFLQMSDLGLIRPVPQEAIETYLPSMHQSLLSALGEGWVEYATVDGVLYGVPAISSAWRAPIVLGVRTDWLHNIGYSEETLPTTLEGLEEMLLKFHTDDPDGNGVADTYALNRFDDYHAYVLGAYGVSSRYWYPDAEGKPATYAVDENYKEALKVLARWYQNGIFDPEIVTDGRNETTAKFINNKLAGYFGMEWAYTIGHSISPRHNAYLQGNPIDTTFIPPVAGPEGKAATTQYSATVATSGMVFGRNCPDAKMIRLLQMMNAIFTNEDLFKYVALGTKDLFYVEDGEGYVDLTEYNTNEHKSDVGAERYLFYSFCSDEVFPWRTPRSRMEAYYQVIDYPVVPVHATSVFPTDAQTEYQASTNKIADEFYWKAIVGEVDVDAEWDAYVQRWLAAGGQEILDAKLALYEGMK